MQYSTALDLYYKLGTWLSQARELQEKISNYRPWPEDISRMESNAKIEQRLQSIRTLSKQLDTEITSLYSALGKTEVNL